MEKKTVTLVRRGISTMLLKIGSIMYTFNSGSTSRWSEEHNVNKTKITTTTLALSVCLFIVREFRHLIDVV